MCGRFTAMYTWEELYNLYMLSVGFPPSAHEELLLKHPVSKRVNNSRTPDDDPTLIEQVKLVS